MLHDTPHISRFSVIWARIINSYLIRLYIIANHLGAIQYANFLERIFPLYCRMYCFMFTMHVVSTQPHLPTFLSKCVIDQKTVFQVQSSGLHNLLIWTHLTFYYEDASKKIFMLQSTRSWWPSQLHPCSYNRHQGPTETTASCQRLHSTLLWSMWVGADSEQFLWRNA
jgi:hypothetical protein